MKKSIKLLSIVFIVIFLALIGSFTFYLGNFFVRGQADLNSFFVFHPWVYILLIPVSFFHYRSKSKKSFIPPSEDEDEDVL